MATMKTGPALTPEQLTRWLKVVAVALALIPAVLLALSTTSSVLSGEGELGVVGWLFMAPLVVLAVVGWWRPYLGGWILVGASIFLAVALLILLLSTGESPTSTITALLVGVLMFIAPPLLAGALFLLVARVGGRAGDGQEMA